jgi:hypothetical protein
VPESSGEGSEDAAEGTESGDAEASEGQGLYLSPINEDEDEEEGVDCECRRIDQEQLSFNVGFFNAKVGVGPGSDVLTQEVHTGDAS